MSAESEQPTSDIIQIIKFKYHLHFIHFKEFSSSTRTFEKCSVKHNFFLLSQMLPQKCNFLSFQGLILVTFAWQNLDKSRNLIKIFTPFTLHFIFFNRTQPAIFLSECKLISLLPIKKGYFGREYLFTKNHDFSKFRIK